jgi:hypothetical protein
MIKAKLRNTKNGRTYFLLGITDDNIARLKEHKPIGIDMSAFDFKPGEPNNVILMWGESLDALQQEMNQIETFENGLVFPAPKGREKAPS